ncbi:hypothetical protein WHR41_03577 [Cladosporium halotolerans]|uniref:C2H2-type domain-containing protein n=1 Tax=Cladosporium halotolerans TaxID=1052096 RepID=A0AB34KVP1_9PEZI
MAKRSRDASVSSRDEEISATAQSRSTSAEPIGHTHKYAQVLDDTTSHTASMRCLLPPHRPLTFSSYPEYETHYTQSHSNRCSECKANFPTARFLELHIAENHDPIVFAQRERGDKTFACFVEGCEKVCSDWKKRRSHLVDKHGFPRNYDFLVVNTGVDGKRSMLRAGIDEKGHRASSRERRGSNETTSTVSTQATSVSPPATAPLKTASATTSSQSKDAQPTSQPPTSPQWKGKKRSGSTRSLPYGAPVAPVKVDMDSIVSSMSALNMVPRSVTNARKS